MDIYQELRERGLTQSLRHFSKRWLSRGPNYACSNMAGYSLDTLHALHGNLKEAGLNDLAAVVVALVFEADDKPTTKVSMQEFTKRMKQALADQGIEEGWPDPVKLPYHVPCLHLARETIGDREFERQFRERKAWCYANSCAKYDVRPIRTDDILTGREFMFAEENDAVLFKLRFC